MEEDKTHHHDIDGKESSKRKAGTRLLNVGTYIGAGYILIGLVMAIFEKPLEYDFPIEIWWTFMGTGAGLLGFTLVERFGRK